MRIGLLGCGMVGNELYKMLIQDGHDVMVAVKNLDKHKEIDPSKITLDPYEIVNDPGIDIIAECLPGRTHPDINFAIEFIRHSLYNKKDVFTCNKMLAQEYADEICYKAEMYGKTVYLNSLVSSDKPEDLFNGEKLTSKNFKKYNSDNIYIFRGGGGTETAKYMYDEIKDYIKDKGL
jgi:homoserine dehydrogenase